MRIRCQTCRRIRVLFRANKCRRCWKDSQPLYRVIELPGGRVQHLASSWIARQIGRQKGARTLHATGKAYRWTPAAARAAAVKRWKRVPVNRRIGIRLGLSAKKRKLLDRAAIRQSHLNSSTAFYCVEDTANSKRLVWRRREAGGGSKPISERTALIGLGLLKNSRGFVPSDDQLRPYTPSTPTLPQLMLKRSTDSGVIYAPPKSKPVTVKRRP